MAERKILDLQEETVGMRIEFTNESMIKIPGIESATIDCTDDDSFMGFKTINDESIIINLKNVNYIQISKNII